MQVTKFPPNIHLSQAESQGKWYFTPGWWKHGLFYLPMPYGFWNAESNRGELMHPWASTETHFYNCQKMQSAGVPRQDSHGRQQLCWVVPSPFCCLIPAREILLVALVVDSNPFFLGCMYWAGPRAVMLRHFTAWVMDVFDANSEGGRQPIV